MPVSQHETWSLLSECQGTNVSPNGGGEPPPGRLWHSKAVPTTILCSLAFSASWARTRSIALFQTSSQHFLSLSSHPHASVSPPSCAPAGIPAAPTGRLRLRTTLPRGALGCKPNGPSPKGPQRRRTTALSHQIASQGDSSSGPHMRDERQTEHPMLPLPGVPNGQDGRR